MTVRYGTTLRDAMLAAMETTLGASPKLSIWSGSAPADCATASSGTKLAEFTLASDAFDVPASGSGVRQIALLGVPFNTTGLATATAGYWRMFTSGGTCLAQGNATGDGLTLSNTSITSGQAVTLNSFLFTLAGG